MRKIAREIIEHKLATGKIGIPTAMILLRKKGDKKWNKT